MPELDAPQENDSRSNVPMSAIVMTYDVLLEADGLAGQGPLAGPLLGRPAELAVGQLLGPPPSPRRHHSAGWAGLNSIPAKSSEKDSIGSLPPLPAW